MLAARGDNVHPISARLSHREPASRARLMTFALMCGVGPSLRTLRGHGDLAANMLSGATPLEMLEDIAMAQVHEPSLGIRYSSLA